MLRLFLIVAVVLLLGMANIAFLLSWGVVSKAERNILPPVIAAFDAGDVTALEQRIAWDKLQDFLRKDIEKRMRNAPNATEGEKSAAVIADIVEYYVQPENLRLLLQYKNHLFAQHKTQNFISDIKWSPFLSFDMVLGYPVHEADISADPRTKTPVQRLRSHIQVTARFTLVGGVWKITELHVPLHLIPRHTYTRPAIEHFNIDTR